MQAAWIRSGGQYLVLSIDCSPEQRGAARVVEIHVVESNDGRADGASPRVWELEAVLGVPLSELDLRCWRCKCVNTLCGGCNVRGLVDSSTQGPAQSA